MSRPENTPTIIFVHAAWADGSSWNKVTATLQAKGLRCLAAPIPMTTLADDIAALERAIARAGETVILVGHAYSGGVVSACTNEKVKGLVFIAGLTPDVGESVGDVFFSEPPHEKAPALAPDAEGFFWLPDDAFPNAFAQNASRTETSLLAAVQRPINGACIQAPLPAASWKTLPSWYLVAEQDRMISPKIQHRVAERMNAHIMIADVDHCPMLTAPQKVEHLIELAIEQVTKQA